LAALARVLGVPFVEEIRPSRRYGQAARERLDSMGNVRVPSRDVVRNDANRPQLALVKRSRSPLRRRRMVK